MLARQYILQTSLQSSEAGQSPSQYRFDSNEWARLTPSEHIYRCYVMAEEAEQLGATASPVLAQAYQELAAKWKEIAQEIGVSESSPI